MPIPEFDNDLSSTTVLGKEKILRIEQHCTFANSTPIDQNPIYIVQNLNMSLLRGDVKVTQIRVRSEIPAARPLDIPAGFCRFFDSETAHPSDICKAKTLDYEVDVPLRQVYFQKDKISFQKKVGNALCWKPTRLQSDVNCFGSATCFVAKSNGGPLEEVDRAEFSIYAELSLT